jgi:N utilization substance protein B
MTAGSRREARERALSLLYEAEIKEQSPVDLLAELPVDPDPFAADLVRGVAEHCDELDGVITGFAIDWALDRMPVVDRNVLRLAVFELLHRPDTPVGAVISEAVELAKRYSTEDSGRFVNGVLASVADSHRSGV